MQQRRINAPRKRPLTAIVSAVALLASAMVGISTNRILHTDGDAIDPVTASINTESLAGGASIVVDDPAIATQGEEPGPRTVKEFTREAPFSQFALTWSGERDIAAFVRAERADGTWSEWYDTDQYDFSDGPSDAKRGTELIYIEPTTKVQVSINNVDLVSEEHSADHNDAADFEVVFIDGGTSELPSNGIQLANDAIGMPRVISRAGWGANESLRCKQPSYFDGVSGITIHHTAGSNNYTEAEAPGIMRGIYQYHAQQLGWCDIGYHALADKYGNLYEGRSGGLNRDVWGAHAGGFNENTWGISMMGNFDTAPTTDVMINAVGQLAGWRAAVAKLNPTGSGTHYSEGTQYSKYAYGVAVQLPNIFAHRDVGHTTCPGQYGYAQMDNIRRVAQTTYDSIVSGNRTDTDTTDASVAAPSTTPTQTAAPANPASPAQPAQTPQELLQGLAGSSQNGSSQNQVVTAAGSLTALALGIAASNNLPGTISQLGNTQLIDGLTLQQLPGIIDAVVKLSDNNDIANAWRDLNATLGPVLGNARSGITTYTGAQGREISYALFDEGIIVSEASTGTNALWGEIGNAWAQQGFDLGPLGLPLNQEYLSQGKIRVDFEGGNITFDPATGKVDIHTS